MKPHIAFAHQLWKDLLSPHDTVVDATCGNGYDTKYLSTLAGHVHSFDIQEAAIESAKAKLTDHDKVTFIHDSHAELKKYLKAVEIKLFVYNLGYLPGGDKSITTLAETSIQSIAAAVELLAPGGMICITLYHGHTEGAREAQLIVDRFPGEHHVWKAGSPSVLILKN